MQLQDLPNELLLDVFRYGGTEALIGGASQACQRLRKISDEPSLWHACLSSQLRSQYLTPAQVDQIANYREWCLKQRSATRRVMEGLDLLVSEMREASPEDIEAYAWQILKLRLRTTEGLKNAKDSPKTIAHFHWAHWLTEVMYRFEGVHMLLKQSTQDGWGNSAVERPIEQVIALYALRNGQFPSQLFDAVYYSTWRYKSKHEKGEEISSQVEQLSGEACEDDRVEIATELVQKVYEIFETVSTRHDFLAVLGRSALFVELAMQAATQLCWHARLLKTPLGTYVCVQPSEGEVFFVDFQREGKMRSLEEFKHILHTSGSSGSVQSGISLYDTLATSYVWHTAPTTTRHCVLDLIEHAALDVKVTYLAQAPRLYTSLVRRIIKRNVSEVENAPLSRAVSSASLASMFGATPGGWLRRGKIVRILAGDHHHTNVATSPPPTETNGTDRQDHVGVVIEVTDGSVLVLERSELVRVIKQMLQPVSNVPLTSVAGLLVPEIGVDLRVLGQYFVQYSTQLEKFE